MIRWNIAQLLLLLFLSGCANETVRSFKRGKIETDVGVAGWTILLRDGMINDGDPLVGFFSINFTSSSPFKKLAIRELKVFDQQEGLQFSMSDQVLTPFKISKIEGGELKVWHYSFSKREIPFCKYRFECDSVFLDDAGSETSNAFKLKGEVLPHTIKQNSFISNF